jgi:hypothetical protein
VDLNAEAIQLSLWIKTAARGKRLTSLDHTIREWLQLHHTLSDPAVHPQAFDWQTAFPEGFAQGGVSNAAPAGCWSVKGQRGHPPRANP